MPLLADNRIPDTTLPDNQFQDGDIFYGDDANKVSDTLKAGVNANYNDIKRLANGELGTVIQPDGSIKYIRLNQDRVLEVSTDNLNYVPTSYAIQDEEGNIANHRPYIYFEGAHVVDNGARIEIHGFQGEQGLTGPQGEQGVQGEQGPAGTSSAVAPQAGFYTLEVDGDGNLYANYPDNETEPEFDYDEKTGNLYVIIDDNQVLVGNIQGPIGETGPQGPQGATGSAGFSPTVETTPISNGTQVTITDAEGPHTFNVENGAGIPDGGTQGQFLRKTANSTEWANVINDDTPSIITTYSSNKVDSLVDGIIDDNDTTTTNTWSAQKINQNTLNSIAGVVVSTALVTIYQENTSNSRNLDIKLKNHILKDTDIVIVSQIAIGPSGEEAIHYGNGLIPWVPVPGTSSPDNTIRLAFAKPWVSNQYYNFRIVVLRFK